MRLRKKWIWLVPAAILLLSWWLLFHGFVLNDVHVYGNADVTVPEIMSAADLERGMPIAFLDWKQLKANIDALGIVELKDTELCLPGTLNLYINRREPVAMIRCGNTILTLDKNLYVVQQHDSVPDMDLICITGMTEGAFAPGRQYPSDQVPACRSVLEVLFKNNAHVHISEIHIADPENITMITGTGTIVHFGNAEAASEKIELMKNVVADLAQHGKSGGEIHLTDRGKADYSP